MQKPESKNKQTRKSTAALEPSRFNRRTFVKLVPALGVAVVAIVTAIGWFVTSRLTKLQQNAKDQLDLVNKQITEFYGPLLIACEAGRETHRALCNKLHVEEVFPGGKPACDKAFDEWVLWMDNIFSPLNNLREKLIMEKLYLVLDDDVRADFHQLIQHVALTKIVLAKWAKGDKSEQFALIEFPRTMTDYARDSLVTLRAQRAYLIGQEDRPWYKRIWTKPVLGSPHITPRR